MSGHEPEWFNRAILQMMNNASDGALPHIARRYLNARALCRTLNDAAWEQVRCRTLARIIGLVKENAKDRESARLVIDDAVELLTRRAAGDEVAPAEVQACAAALSAMSSHLAGDTIRLLHVSYAVAVAEAAMSAFHSTSASEVADAFSWTHHLAVLDAGSPIKPAVMADHCADAVLSVMEAEAERMEGAV